MDPISITTGVLALVGNSIKLLDIVHTYSSEFQRAELNIRLLSTECKTLQHALIEIDKLCSNKDEANNANPSMRIVLGDCEEQFKIILEKLQPFMQHATVGSSPPDLMSIRARISATWNRQDIDSYRQCIQRQAGLVNLLLNALQLQSVMKIREIVEGPKFQELLKKSHHDTKSLRTTNARDKSLFYAESRSTKDFGSTTGTDAESDIGDEEFPFDEDLINTPAYRRAFKARQHIISGQDQAESATSRSSAKRSSTTGLSKFFRRAMKMEESEASSSSTAKTAGADSNIVEPSDETIVRGDIVITEQDVRDAKAQFYELMALHREILAMKFADNSYNKILKEKVMRPAYMVDFLKVTISGWKSMSSVHQTSFTSGEIEAVEEARYSLVSLGTSLLFR